MSTAVPAETPRRSAHTPQWIELDRPDDREPMEGMSTLTENWVRVDPVDDLVARLKTKRLRLTQDQVHTLLDILGGWQPEEEILSDRLVQEGIDEAIREFEEWKNSISD